MQAFCIEPGALLEILEINQAIFCIPKLMFFLVLFVGETSTSEMLVALGTAQLDEFYPAVAIGALMRIMRDPALSTHHNTVIQVIVYLLLIEWQSVRILTFSKQIF